MLSASKFLSPIALAQGAETDVQAWSRMHATSDIRELRDFAARHPSSGLADIEGRDGPAAPRIEPVSPSPAFAPVLAG